MTAPTDPTERAETILALSFYPSTIRLVVQWLDELDRRITALEHPPMHQPPQPGTRRSTFPKAE